MHQTLSVEGSTVILPKTQPSTPRLTKLDPQTQSPTREIFSRERSAGTPNLTGRARRAVSFGETKTVFLTHSSKLEKIKNSGAEISPSSEVSSFELHVSKVPITKINDAEPKVILPLFQSLPKQKKVSFSPAVRLADAKSLQSDNFINLFRKVQENKNETSPKRDITPNDSPLLRSTKTDSPLRSTGGSMRFGRSSGSFTARDKDDTGSRRSLRTGLSLRLLQLRPVEVIENIDIPDLEHKDMNVASVSESRNTARARGHSISSERILIQPFSVNNIYKQKVQLKKTSLSQLKVDLKSIKKTYRYGKGQG